MPLSTQVVEMGSGELNDADNPAMYNHPIQEGAGGGGGGRGDGGLGRGENTPSCFILQKLYDKLWLNRPVLAHMQV